MDLRLENKVALVTGGSRGIGAAIVDTLAGEGCRVHFTHIGDADAALRTAAALNGRGLGATVHETDAADRAQAEQLVSEIVAVEGGLDLLVCNAGITADGVSWKLTEAMLPLAWSERLPSLPAGTTMTFPAWPGPTRLSTATSSRSDPSWALKACEVVLMVAA